MQSIVYFFRVREITLSANLNPFRLLAPLFSKAFSSEFINLPVDPDRAAIAAALLLNRRNQEGRAHNGVPWHPKPNHAYRLAQTLMIADRLSTTTALFELPAICAHPFGRAAPTKMAQQTKPLQDLSGGKRNLGDGQDVATKLDPTH